MWPTLVSLLLSSNQVVIPNEPIVENRFAETLIMSCQELSRASRAFSAAPGSLDAAAMRHSIETLHTTGSADEAKKTAREQIAGALKALRATCEGLARVSVPFRLGRTDIANLRVLRNAAALYTQVIDSVDLSEDTVAAGIGDLAIRAGELQSSIVPAAGLDTLQSTLVAGLADFVFDRAKAEAALYARETMQKKLCEEVTIGSGDEKTKVDMKTYFPDLCLALGALDGQLSLNAMGKALRRATARDLENLPEVVFSQAIAKNPALAEPLVPMMVALAFFREARRGRAPVDLLANIHRAPKLDCEEADGPGSCSHVMNAFRLASATLYALRADTTPFAQQSLRYHVISLLLTIEEETSLGLLAATAPSSPCAAGSACSERLEALTSMMTALPRIVARAKKTADLEAHLVRRIEDAMKNGKDGVRLEEQVALLELASRDLVGLADEVAPVLRLGDAQRDDIRLAAEAVELGSAIVLEDFGEAVLSMRELVGRLAAKTNVGTLDLPAPVLSGAVFVSELASAESSDEVTRILEAAAAPVGSYRVKYQRRTVGLGALLGVASGQEWLTAKTRPAGAIISVFSPVGAHATMNLGSSVHAGLFLAVLDLGTLTSTRIAEETSSKNGVDVEVDSEPNLSFRQVFAPGAFVTLGVAGPLVIGGGVQAVPEARKVRIADTATQESTSALEGGFRALGFVSVDVTFWVF